MLPDKAIDQAQAETVTRYLDVGCPFAYADMAFVCGTRLPDPISLVIDVFRQQKIAWVTLTGGVNKQTGVIEADVHHHAPSC